MQEEKTIGRRNGLVLEGGGLRGMFTDGILDVLMEEGIEFDGLAGVSAGALFGCNYKSRQHNRAIRYNCIHHDNPEYMSWHSLWETGDFVNADFAYRKIPYDLDPFDFEAFRLNPMKFYVVCTDIDNGCAFYRQIDDADGDGLQWMRASASMPFFARPVELNGVHYLDGGITDSIPLEFMQNQGYDRNVVILTQPIDFRKRNAHLYLTLKLLVKQYPKVAELMRVRHIMYNNELDYIKAEAAKGNTLIICPDSKLDIGRLNLDVKKMREVYYAGVRKATEMMPQLKEFLRK